MIVRALGMKETVRVDTSFFPPRADDIVLLCSDGLSGPVTDDEMQQIVSECSDLKTGVRRLIERANENGGPDNITCVLAKWIA